MRRFVGVILTGCAEKVILAFPIATLSTRCPIKKEAGLEASQVLIFNDTPMKFSGYHRDIIGFCLQSNTEVVTSLLCL